MTKENTKLQAEQNAKNRAMFLEEIKQKVDELTDLVEIDHKIEGKEENIELTNLIKSAQDHLKQVVTCIEKFFEKV